MEFYDNLTDCNVLHSIRMCSKRSFFSTNITFDVYRDCGVPGILFDIVSTLTVGCITVVGNLFISIVIWSNRNEMWNSYGVCKIWLSVCDIIMAMIFMPVRVMMIIQNLFQEPDYPPSLVQQARRIVAQATRAVLEEQLPEINGNNLVDANHSYPTNSTSGLNLQTIVKAYELQHRTLIVAMCCLLATYILTATWVLAIMSVDRQLAIVHPFFYKRHVTLRRNRAALVVATLFAILNGTVWPIAHIDLFHASINNRFGLGASFLLGRNSIFNSREIFLFYLAWSLPLLIVIACNMYTAYFCLFVMSKGEAKTSNGHASARACWSVCWRKGRGRGVVQRSLNRKNGISPKLASAQPVQTLRPQTSSQCRVSQACSNWPKNKELGQVGQQNSSCGRSAENGRASAEALQEGPGSNGSIKDRVLRQSVGRLVAASRLLSTRLEKERDLLGSERNGVSERAAGRRRVSRTDETLEAFWTLTFMTVVFMLIMTTSFVFTAFIPVPCEDSPAWTWLYATVLFFFLNTPSQHIVVYNLRSPRFRQGVKRIARQVCSRCRR